MNKNFKKMIKVIHSQSENELPTIKFSNSLKKYSKKARDTIEHFEAMLTLLEAHPFLPVNESFSLGSQSLNDRKTLAYEVIIRQIGHSRSLIANANIFNHIGMSVALRCMIELYAFVKFLHDKKDEMDESEWNILLNGSTNSRGEFYEYEIFWEKEFGKPPPRSFNKFFREFMKTPNVGKYLKKVKKNDKGFDLLYAVYSQYIHPTFGPPRERIMAISNYSDNFEYYDTYKNKGSDIKTIIKEIDVGDFCLQMCWSEIFQLDPMFDKTAHQSFPDHLKELAVSLNRNDIGDC